MFVKLDSAIADVPTDRNVSAAGIHSFYMYESYSKRYFGILWSGWCDITKSGYFHHLFYFKYITLAILSHKHGTCSLVCTKYGSKIIAEKFKVLVKGHTK